MSRYFYHSVLLVLLTNTIIFVPSVLVEHRFDGAIASMMLSIPIGSVLAFAFTRSMMTFKGKGLPEIFQDHLPALLRVPILLFLGTMWYIAGSVVLISFAFITQRFINPDLPTASLLFGFLFIMLWASTRSTLAVVNTLEIIIVISLPLIAFISFKALSSNMMDWDAIWSMSDYVFRMPSWDAFVAATYLFTGYVNLSILNRLYVRTKIRHLWMIPLMGTLICLTSFFIPIGLHGTMAVQDYVYIWVSTADTLRLDHGFIERVLFLYMFMYLLLSLIFITMSWNVGNELLRGCFPIRNSKRKNLAVKYSIVVLFCILTFIGGLRSDEKLLTEFVKQWFLVRFIGEIGLVFIILVLSWRKRHVESA